MTQSILPDQFIVFDLEWTAWSGSRARNWSGAGEYREIFDIGAARVDGQTLEIIDTYRQLVTLELVDQLPPFSTKLTGITQADIDAHGIPFAKAVSTFATFSRDLPLYSWGPDDGVVIENCRLKQVSNPFTNDQFNDMRDVFKPHGVPADDYYSSTIVEYFGQQNKHTAHQSLDDVLNIVEALHLLQERGKQAS